LCDRNLPVADIDFTGDSGGNQGGAAFFEEFYLLLLEFDQVVDFGGFVIEESGDLGLFF
jgi:hypothetical protein